MRDSVIADIAASDGLGGCCVGALVVIVCVECLLRRWLTAAVATVTACCVTSQAGLLLWSKE
jgi:hypothetical protein